MAQWSISEIGRKVGLRASAIRYYEQIGILEPARRVSGQRRYNETVLYRLAVVRRARRRDLLWTRSATCSSGSPIPFRFRNAGRKLRNER